MGGRAASTEAILNRRSKIAVGIAAIVVVAGFAYRYYENLFDEPCPLRSCRLQAIMSSVVFVQEDIESRALKSGSLAGVGAEVKPPQSKYLTYSRVTVGGVIVVEDSRVGFIAVFDPVLAEGKLAWHCSAQPPTVMESSSPSNISDCGAKYRKLLPAK